MMNTARIALETLPGGGTDRAPPRARPSSCRHLLIRGTHSGGRPAGQDMARKLFRSPVVEFWQLPITVTEE
jgi:hypothetical protein